MGVVKDIFDILSWPLRSLMNYFVQQEAQTLAVKHAVTRVAIRMYVDQYAHAGKFSPDEAVGKSVRIWDILSREMDSQELDIEKETTLQRIKDEVTVTCVPLNVWVILSALPPRGKGTVQEIGVGFRGPKGEDINTVMNLGHIQEYFLFHQPFIWTADSSSQTSDIEVSSDVSRLMKRIFENQKITLLRVKAGPVGSVGMEFMRTHGEGSTRPQA